MFTLDAVVSAVLLLAVVSLLASPKAETRYQETVLCQDVLGVIDRTGVNASQILNNTRHCVRVWGCGEDFSTCPVSEGFVSKRVLGDCTLFCEVSR